MRYAPMDRAPAAAPDVFTDLDALSHAAAKACIAAATEAVAAYGTFAFCLTGGSTPKRLYELLAGPYESQMPWEQTHLFWGDERYVPYSDDASNYGMARAAVVDRVAVPENQVHPMPTDYDTPEEAAAAYETTLRAFAEDRPGGAPLFDLLLLGMGADGHICSLFPEGNPHQGESDHWVCAPYGPPRHTPRQRLSLTLAALSEARDALFLVSGAKKKDAAQAVLREHDATRPATHVRARRQVRWLLDAAASPDA